MNSRRFFSGFTTVFLLIIFGSFMAESNGKITEYSSFGAEPPEIQKETVKRNTTKHVSPTIRQKTAIIEHPELVPDSTSILLHQGIDLYLKKFYTKSYTLFKEYVRKVPTSPEGWYWFGLSSRETGRFQEAQDAFKKTLEIFPDFPAFSRILVYPQGSRKALWDPCRPARIIKLTSEKGGFLVLPPYFP